MKVKITEVFDGVNGVHVRFECECGEGVAIWAGAAPCAGETKFIELAIPTVLARGDLVETTEPVRLRVEGQATELIGQVVEAEGGYVRLAVGPEGLNIDVDGDVPLVGRRYRIVTDSLQAFDCEY